MYQNGTDKTTGLYPNSSESDPRCHMPTISLIIGNLSKTHPAKDFGGLVDELLHTDTHSGWYAGESNEVLSIIN